LARQLKDRHPEIAEKKIVKINTEELIYKPEVVPKLEKPSFTRGEV
jgi:hypothetical protein